MQTKKRWDVPRNRVGYAVDACPILSYGNNNVRYWLCVNAAEFWIWVSGKSARGRSLAERSEHESNKARARFWLGLSRSFMGK